MSNVAHATNGKTTIKAFLFKQLVPLARGEHDALGLSSQRSYSEYNFHWLPLVASEIAAAAEHLPIVISDTQQPMLAAVVGLHKKQSLFIDRHGRWVSAYLPLYLRQMPFQIVRLRAAAGPAQPVICVDIDSPLVDEVYPEKIIDGGQLSANATDALNAAREFEQGAAASAALAQAMERAGLTVSLAAVSEAADCLSLRALKAVSPTRLQQASPQALAPFANSGTMPLLESCARSIRNFAALRQLQEHHYADQEAHLRADL